MAEPVPWFDEARGQRVYPVFHVIAAAAAASGAEVIAAASSAPRRVAALGWQNGGTRRLLIANLTPDVQRVTLNAASLAGAEIRVLDAAAFAAATAGPDWAERPGAPISGGRIDLAPYAVGFVTLGAA
jgi:hypothetical protein